MYLEQVKIENIRGIDSKTIDLSPGVNLLIGDNGTGKSSALKAIRSGLSGIFRELPGVPTRGILSDDLRMEMHSESFVSQQNLYVGPSSVECFLTNRKEPHEEEINFQWERYRDIYLSARTNMSSTAVAKYFMDLSNDPNQLLPIIFYQNDKRGSENVSRANFDKKQIKDRRAGYVRALDGVTDIQQIRNWALLMEMTAFQRRVEIPGYAMFKAIISDFMMSIEDNGKKVDIYYDANYGDFVYRENSDSITIDKLSAGYQALVWTIMDIAYRAVTLNPGLEGPYQDIPGIILLDEIDMHLHPKWQWNIISALTKTFPRVQFILTTHSPIIISSSRRANIIAFGDCDDIYSESIYGKNVQDILEYTMGSAGRPNSVQKKIKRFDADIESNNLDQAQESLELLKQELSDNHPDYQKAREKLEMYKWVEEN